MTKTLLTASAATLMLLSTAVMADQNRNCGPRDTVLNHLSKKYGETRQSIGLDARGGLVEVFASDQSGSWTITVTTPAGVTCLIASGQSFETLDTTVPAKSDPV